MIAAKRGPARAEVKLLVEMAEAVEKMRGFERLRAVEPDAFDEFVRARQTTRPQGLLDDLEGGHPEAAMLGAEPLGERAMHLMVRAAFHIGRHDSTVHLQK